MAPGRVFNPFLYFKDQLKALPAVSSFVPAGGLVGKTVIVTGANVGLGLETARHIARLTPAKLILASRDQSKTQLAADNIRATTGFAHVEAWPLDLGDFSSISAFATRYEKEGPGHLDILINNAGVNTEKYTLTKDSWETTLQINHLGNALLALLLLPQLKNAPATPRLVMVSSEVHYFLKTFPEGAAPNILEKLNDRAYCTRSIMGKRYFQSKLLNLFFARALASRLPYSASGVPSVTVVAVNPGWCKTALFREIGVETFTGKLIVLFSHVIARTSEMGSRTILWAALSSDDKKVHGHYSATCRVEEESDFVISKEGGVVQEKLWEETVEVLRKADSRVTSNLAAL